MAETTICFVARVDFESVPGGDTVQWQMYARAARAAGLNTVTWFDDGPLPDADVFHAFNVDRPLEIYPKLVRAKRQGRPFILSTIHHPAEWVVRFRRARLSTGVLGRLRRRLGSSMGTSDATREVALLMLQRRFRHLGDLFPSWSRRVRWLLTNADQIALLVPPEAAYIEKDFDYAVRPDQALVVPNWAACVAHDLPDKPALFNDLPEAPVIVVGRIEPRKSSLHLCRWAELARRHVVFIGRPLWGDSTFAASFEKAVLGSRYVHWIPGVPRPEMAPFYRHASFLLNASCVEVSPLVDIEALASGCPVVTTRYALHHALLPPDTPLCDPYDEQSILERLQWRPARLAPRHVVEPEPCKRDLIDAYVRLARTIRGAVRVPNTPDANP